MDIGGRLRAARETLGYTQQELADQVDLGRDAIVSIETGDRRVKVEELIRIARVLERPLTFFLRETPPGELTVVARRGQVATREARRAELWLERRLEDYTFVLEALGERPTMQVGLQWPTDWCTDEAAWEAARAQRRLLGLGDRAIQDFRAFLERKVGVLVFGKPVRDPDFLGLLGVRDRPAAAAMLVKSTPPAARCNFTMALLYGHLVWKLANHDYSTEVAYRSADDERPGARFVYAFVEEFLCPTRHAQEIREGAPERLDYVVRREPARKHGMWLDFVAYARANRAFARTEAGPQRHSNVGHVPLQARDLRPFPEASENYWSAVLRAYRKGVLEAGRCAEMLEMTALEFDDMVGELQGETASGEPPRTPS